MLRSIRRDGSSSSGPDPPSDQLYYQMLDVNGLPMDAPRVVANAADIGAVDLTAELPGGIRFVVYSTDAGLFLQVINSAGIKLGGAIQIQ